MQDELNLVNEIIMVPEKPRRRRPVNASHTHKRRSGRGFTKFLFVILLLLVVLGIIFSFADIGGNVILGYAQKYISDNYKLTLNAESITGNPVKGYTLNNFEILDAQGQKILSAGSLSGRVNFPALLTGKIRLAEISLGGISMDIDQFMKTLQNFKLPTTSHRRHNAIFSATPAFADNPQNVPDIPVDRVSITDSKFTSQFGVIDVKEIGADLANFDIDIDAAINNIPLKGVVDMGESAGLTAINRSDITFGSGKIIATGGLVNDALDLHASIQGLNLGEMTALYPAFLSPSDFEGNANLNIDITGTPEDPKILGSVDYKGSKLYNFPVERVSANLAYSDNRITVNNILANAFKIPIQGELAAASRPDEPLSVMIKLDGSEANLDGMDKILEVPDLKGLGGKVSTFNANISGPVNALNGLINFTAPKISYSGRTLSNIKAQIKLAHSDTASVNGKFSFEGSQGYLNGSIASFLVKPNMNVTAKIVDLDIKKVEDLIPDASDYKLAGKITASVNVKGSTSNPVISGSLSSPEFSGMDQKITKPVINFSFANKNLTLTKTEGTLNGMPISVTGTVGPLPSDNPSLNINATITMSPAALKNYVPDINNYALKGNINAGVKIQGTANSPSINLLASSQNIQAMDMISAKNLELTTALNGDLSKLDKIKINASAQSITASGVTFTNAKAAINKDGDKITLGSLNAQAGSGSITGSGSASVSGKNPLDFNFKFTNLNLAPLASASGVDMKGNLTGTLKVSGNNSNPAINFSANVPSLNASGFTLEKLIAEISGNMQDIKLNKVRAEVEGVEVTATGNIQVTPALKVNIALKGNNIKLERLLKDYPDLKGNLSGVANLAFNITGNDKNISCKGSLTSSAINAYGLKLSSVNLPLAYSGNNFTSSGGTAKLYGGTAKNNLTFDINAMKFTDNIEASGIDVNALIQDMSGGLEGKITGTGKLTMKINGTAKGKTSYSGSGNFSMGSGGITGFKWLNFITRLHKSDGIRYASVNAPLTLQTGKLIIKAGTIANANKDDALYKYAKLSQDGSVDFSGKDVTINFMTESSINYQLINAIQGGGVAGLQALFKGGTTNLKDGLQAFLQGGLTGAQEKGSAGDFRVVNLKVAGKAASPSFSGLKIGGSTLKAQEDKNSESKKTQIQQTVQNTQQAIQKKGEDLIDKTLDKLLPTKKTDSTKAAAQSQNQKKTQAQTQKQKQTQNQKPTREQKKEEIKERAKEEIKKGLQKGLGGLFKK